MKRSPLKRKTPLKRGASQLKRTPLKRGESQLKRSPLNRGGSELKRSPLKKESAKHKARREEAREWRKSRTEGSSCWICGTSEKKRKHPIREHNNICVHEIAGAWGANRQKAIDKGHSTIVCCWKCNLDLEDRSVWPEARQLAVILKHAPDDYDLVAHNSLVNDNAPNRVTQCEVLDFIPSVG